MTRAVAYVRISRDPSERRVGVERQRREVAELAARLGLTVETWHEDNDISAYSGKLRPAFAQMLGDITAGRVSTLLAWDQDRIARDVVDWERVLRACQATGTRVAFVTDGSVDLSTVGGRQSSRFKAVVGRSESEQKSERVKGAVRERAAAGKAHGRVLYGWRRIYEHDSQGVRIRGQWHDVIDEPAADLVRETSRRVLAGESFKALVGEYTARGITAPLGGKWDPASLRALLVRPANVGLRVHQGKVLGDAEAPAILERGEWDRLLSLLRDPSRRSVSHNNTKHLLTGIARCGVCGDGLRAKHARYVCPRGCLGRLKERVDEYVTAVVVGRLQMPDALSLLAVDDSAAETAARQAAELRARLERLTDDYADGILDRDGMKRAAERIRPRLDEAEARARRTSSHASDVLSEVVGPDAALTWASLPIHRQRAVVNALLAVTVLKLSKGHGGRAPFDPGAIRLDWKGAP